MIDFTAAPGPRALERLQGEQTAWFVTSGRDGVPQPTPVWFLWENDQIVVFSQPNTGKTRAIARNPHVAFHFNFGGSGDDVQVFTGTAAIDADGPRAHEMPTYIEKYGSGMASIGMTPESFAADYSVRVVMTPEKLRGW
jgi:PPOX class probable F420-dependent enzyme